MKVLDEYFLMVALAEFMFFFATTKAGIYDEPLFINVMFVK